jgi:hypothetical protein
MASLTVTQSDPSGHNLFLKHAKINVVSFLAILFIHIWRREIRLCQSGEVESRFLPDQKLCYM